VCSAALARSCLRCRFEWLRQAQASGASLESLVPSSHIDVPHDGSCDGSLLWDAPPRTGDHDTRVQRGNSRLSKFFSKVGILFATSIECVLGEGSELTS